MKFKINTAKTKLMTPGNRQTVTGIVVNEKPQVVFHKRN
jgi:RNA-directed DNA polymerase